MNKNLIYTLDPYIISIIFHTGSDEKTSEVYNELATMLSTVLEETMKDYLLENKFTPEEVQKVLDTEDLEKVDPKFKPYLQNVILQKRIDDNTSLLLHTYYDQVLPQLTPEENAKLEDYIKQNEEILNGRREIVRQGLTEMKKILEENGVENFDELKDKLANPNMNPSPRSLSVNLGGVASTASIPAEQQEPTIVAPGLAQPTAVVPAPESTVTVVSAAQPVINNEPVVAGPVPNVPEPTMPENVENQTEMPVPPLEETGTAPAPEDATASPFDWTSLIMDQIEANNTASPEATAVSTVNNTTTTPVQPAVESSAVIPATTPVVAPIASSIPAPTAIATELPAQPTLSAAAVMDNLGVLDNAPSNPPTI